MRVGMIIFIIITILTVVSCQENPRSKNERYDPEIRKIMAEESAAFLKLSELHFAHGYRKYGLDDLKRAFMKNPYDQESFVRVTKILEQEEDWETLVDFFNYAITKYGAHPLLYRNIGICYYRIGEFHKAVNSFKNAVAMESTNPQNYVYLAKTYEKLNKPKEALNTWKLLLIILDRLQNPEMDKIFREEAEISKERLEKFITVPATTRG